MNRTLRPLSVAFTIVVTACASAPKASSPEPAAAAAPSSQPSADCARDAGAAIDASLAGPQRSDKNKARDVYRHPKETLMFMGIKPTMNVVELWAGGGWYTEVLAPVLAGCGHLTSAAKKNSDDYKTMIAGSPVYSGVKVEDVDVTKGDVLAPDGTVDAVLTFRNIHNWIAQGAEAQVYAAAFKALKSGGVFGIEEHRAAPGTDVATTSKSGYVDEAAVIKRIEAAGFVLDAKSEINANPKDTKNYAEGVWTLPPVLRLGDKDREKYTAIGESDRMTLRFKKP